jgi:threonine/homoserine/homoserine lactone efflux protein
MTEKCFVVRLMIVFMQWPLHAALLVAADLAAELAEEDPWVRRRVGRGAACLVAAALLVAICALSRAW